MKNGLIAFGCVVFPVLVVLSFVAMVLLIANAGPKDEIPVELRPIVATTLITLFVAVVGSLAMMIVEMVDAGSNPRLCGGNRTLWICLIWFLNIFVITIYWYCYMRPVHSEPRTELEF